ncbi:hypothetical protein ACVVIH_21535 [Chryseobacterium arthrosphaerae]|uniref:hypothetical protein n=1 Tax=Chryseobacterium arthrosphaerae TaxID=651561 RepID=UPI003D32F7FB
MMENLKKLNIELRQYLQTISGNLTGDLVRLLKGENIAYLENKNLSDIKAFYFEYEFEYLNIICWGVDAAGRMATKTKALPEKTENAACENEKWSALIPEKIWTEAADFQDHYDGDDFDDILDEYDDEKYRLFEQWFFDCWKEAKAQTSVMMDAYFSIHDTYFRTDLNTLKTINEDEIAQRYL